MPRRATLAMLAAAATACGDQPLPTAVGMPTLTTVAEAERAFSFLAPLGPELPPPGSFDAGAVARVEICGYGGDFTEAACDKPVQEYSVDGKKPRRLTIGSAAYEAEWHTKPNLDQRRTYRIRVFDGAELLGFIDAGFDDAREGPGYYSLTRRETLPIRFWIGTSGQPSERTEPVVVIAQPLDGDEFAEGAPIGFAGSATDADDASLTGAALVWTAAGNTIGTGASFEVVLPVGEHEVTLTATDAFGLAASASVTLRVVAAQPAGGDPYLRQLPGFRAAWEADSDAMSGFADGEPVTDWFDSGGTFHTTAASADATSPTFVADALNGRPAVHFNGHSMHNFVRTAQQGIPAIGDGLTIYAVVRNTPGANDPWAWDRTIISQFGTGSWPEHQYRLLRHDVFGAGWLTFQVVTDEGSRSLSSEVHSFPGDEWALVTARLRDGVMVTLINGVEVASATHGGTIQGVVATSTLNIGSTRDGINVWGGEIASVYLYDVGHDDETTATVQERLLERYGLGAPSAGNQ